jgi:oligosaccharide repeat unit polymerase
MNEMGFSYMMYVLMWLIVLVISFWLFQKAAGTMSILKPNLLSVSFYYSLFSSTFIGSLLIVLGIDNHYMIRLLSSESFRVIGFYIICFIMIFLPLTMYLVSNLFGFQADKEFQRYLKAPVRDESNHDLLTFLIYLGLTGLSLLAILYTIMHLEHIPILELMKGSENLGQLRIEASHGFTGNTLIRNIFGIALTPVLSMITFIYAYKTRKLKWILLFAVTFPSAVFIQVYDLAKAPIFFYTLMFLLLLIYMGVFRLTWFRVALLGIIGGAGLVLMYIFIQGVTDIDQFLSYNRGPIGRLILSQVAPFYLHLDLFTDRLPLLMGKSLPSTIIGLYDMEQIRSARLAMEVFFPEKVEAGTAGVLNTLYAAEAFANFGYAGVILGTIYVGVFIQFIYILFIRLPKNPLFLTLFVYFTVNIPRVMIGGFADFLLNTLWIAVVVVLVSPHFLVYLYQMWKEKKLSFRTDTVN